MIISKENIQKSMLNSSFVEIHLGSCHRIYPNTNLEIQFIESIMMGIYYNS